MAKRMMMVMLFLGAIGLAGLINPSTADARHGCSRGYYGGGHYHGGPVYSRSYYGGGGFYSPYRSYYRGGPGFYGGSGLYYGGHRGGLYIRF